MKRTHTAPGVAPPAPGAVCPHPPAHPHARSGEYLLSAADQDDVPTRPDNRTDPDLLKLVRLVDAMPAVERRRFVAMTENYTRCALGRRVLIEELARELGAKKT